MKSRCNLDMSMGDHTASPINMDGLFWPPMEQTHLNLGGGGTRARALGISKLNANGRGISKRHRQQL
jgi:hypothetical protein